MPADIPTDIPEERVIFTADRYISNGTIPYITHIVYVDPEQYSQLPTRQDMLDVGRAVGRLNKILTKRKFILMGPGKISIRDSSKDAMNEFMIFIELKKSTNFIKINTTHRR